MDDNNTRSMIAKLLKKYREKAGLSVREAGELVNKSGKTVSAWENERGQPDAEMFIKLCEVYKVESVALFFGQDPMSNLNNNEKQFIDMYRTLSKVQQANIEKELNWYADLNKAVNIKLSKAPEYTSMIIFNSPAAAGDPLHAESDFEHIDFPINEVKKHADFGIRILGDSMEPTIKNGEIVWVHKQSNLDDGDIGIFMLGDSAVCKRANLNKQGRIISLNSDNSEYKPINGYELENIHVIGKVLL